MKFILKPKIKEKEPEYLVTVEEAEGGWIKVCINGGVLVHLTADGKVFSGSAMSRLIEGALGTVDTEYLAKYGDNN